VVGCLDNSITMKSSRVTEWERSDKTLRDGVSLKGSDDRTVTRE